MTIGPQPVISRDYFYKPSHPAHSIGTTHKLWGAGMIEVLSLFTATSLTLTQRPM